MGLLDDAIREHLDLKRRHGADPSEVARQEREAFGHGPMPAPPAAPAESAVQPAAPAVEPVAETPPAPPAPEAHRTPEAPAEDIDWSEPPPLDDEPQPPADAEADPDSEDVLEDTPEFLQETPDHDRLWFEQRPPRDFDF